MADPTAQPSIGLPSGGSITTATPTVEQAVLRTELANLSRNVDKDFANLNESFNMRFASLERHLTDQDVARDLQAKEYERRLEMLNKSHETAIQIQTTYVNKTELKLETDDMKRRNDSNTEAIAKLVIDMTRLTSLVGQVTTDVSALTTSQTWLSRIVIGAVIVALVGFVIGGGTHLTGVGP